MTSARRTRWTMLTGVFFAAAVAGCGSAGSSSSGSAPAAAPSSSAAAPSSSAATPASPASSATAVSSPSAGATSPAVAGTPACATSDLRVSAGLAQGAAGSVYQVLDFTNISGSSCTVFGYPGVSQTTAKAQDTQVGQAASRSSAAAAGVVTLAPGKMANALLRITQAENYPAARCHPVTAHYLQIFPPDQRAPIYLTYRSTGCAVAAVNLLTIGVLQAGSGG